ncbi:NAD-dependent epimerase/dehydratase family protein [Sphaerisporangium corydalis]|uniref:NAD-dependent epimerase/dehydratase family protein n=1 Tax=Sphaerisporangium corydalis TaxID=1441875 RepID=A0ABV9E7K1_9ACTN|nr:NAD-dependent epimerase/dehydratase family protein [Sphaerisporangium corydalis]
MAETVLVTGGTGYVGGWCVVELLRRGFTVRTTVRSLSKEPAVRAAVSGAVDPGDRLTVVAADLTSDDGWDAAVAGCDYVLHVASPLGVDDPKDPDTLIVPARDGALRVLRAATRAGVKRVVLTSSTAAASPPLAGPDSVNDETVWTDTEDRRLNAYRKSKTISERAAWRFMEEHQGPTTLATVLPGAVLGPVLTPDNLGSAQVVDRLMKGSIPGVPRLGFTVVDVRDLADLHIRAMTSPEAAGQRFIGVTEFMWMAEIAEVLRSKLGTAASKVPTRRLPSFLLRAISLFDPAIRSVTPSLDHKHVYTSEKAQRLLDWHPRPAATTVVDCAESLTPQRGERVGG